MSNSNTDHLFTRMVVAQAEKCLPALPPADVSSIEQYLAVVNDRASALSNHAYRVSQVLPYLPELKRQCDLILGLGYGSLSGYGDEWLVERVVELAFKIPPLIQTKRPASLLMTLVVNHTVVTIRQQMNNLFYDGVQVTKLSEFLGSVSCLQHREAPLYLLINTENTPTDQNDTLFTIREWAEKKNRHLTTIEDAIAVMRSNPQLVGTDTTTLLIP